MVRTQVYLTNKERDGLAALAGATGKKQSELIREAVDRLIEQSSKKRRDAVLDNAPDYVVAARSSPISGFVSDSTFLRQYGKVAEFGSGEWSYVLYSRRF